MSDDNRIILDAANFDRSMPKWATEESLSRLSTMIKNANKEEQKALRNMQQTLKDVSRINKEAFNRDKKSSDDILKELKKISKIVAKTADEQKKSTRKTGTGNDSTSKETNKKLEKIVSTSERSSDVFIKSIDKLISSNKTENERIIDAIKNLEKVNKDSSKSINDAIKKSSKESKDDNDHISSLLEKANDVNTRSEKILEEIQESIKDLSDRLSKELSQRSDNIYVNENSGDATNTDSVAENRYRDKVLTGMNAMNRTLGYISNTLEVQNRVSSEILGNTTSKEDFTKLFKRQRDEYARIYSKNHEKSGNNLRDMFERSRRHVEDSDNAYGMEKLSSVLGFIGKGLNGILSLLKITKLGTAFAGLSAAGVLVTKAAEYAYDTQRDFREMSERGFNFRVLGAESVDSDGSSRLDGITVRRTITDNEIGLDTATKILEHNTRLINNLGLSTVFEDIGEVLGSSTDRNSIANRLMMTRDQVALITGDFYAIRHRVSDLNSDYTDIERQNMAEQFVRNVRGMSQALGVSIDEIRNYVKEFTRSDDFAAYEMYLPGTEILTSSLASVFGDNSPLSRAIFHTMTSALGAVDTRVQESLGDSLPFMLPILDQMRQEFGDIDFQNPKEINEALLYFVTEARSLAESFDSTGSQDSELSVFNTLFRQFPLLAQAIRSDTFETLTNAQENDLYDPERLTRNASELQNQRVFLENLRAGLDAQIENMFAQMADSATGREMIMATFELDELLKNSQLALVSGVNNITELLSEGPIPRILSNVRSGIRRIIDLFQSLPNFLSNRPGYQNELDRRESRRIYDYMRNNVFGGSEEAFNRLFQEKDDGDGNVTLELADNIESSDIVSVFGEAFKNVETTEERNALAGLLASLERGLDTGDVSTTQEFQDSISLANEQLRYIATEQVGGDARQNIDDIFEGFSDSVRAAIRETATDTRESLREQNPYLHAVPGYNVFRVLDSIRKEGMYVPVDNPMSNMSLDEIDAILGRREQQTTNSDPFTDYLELSQIQSEINRLEQNIQREIQDNTGGEVSEEIIRSNQERLNEIANRLDGSNIEIPVQFDTRSERREIEEPNVDNYYRELFESLQESLQDLFGGFQLSDENITVDNEVSADVDIDYSGIDSRFQSQEQEFRSLIESMQELFSGFQLSDEDITVDNEVSTDVDIDYSGIDSRFQSQESEFRSLIESMQDFISSFQIERDDIIINNKILNVIDFNELPFNSLLQRQENDINSLIREFNNFIDENDNDYEDNITFNNEIVNIIEADYSGIDSRFQSQESEFRSLIESMQDLFNGFEIPNKDITIDNEVSSDVDIDYSGIDSRFQSQEQEFRSLIESMQELFSGFQLSDEDITVDNEVFVDNEVSTDVDIDYSGIDSRFQSQESEFRSLIESMRDLFNGFQLSDEDITVDNEVFVDNEVSTDVDIDYSGIDSRFQSQEQEFRSLIESMRDLFNGFQLSDEDITVDNEVFVDNEVSTDVDIDYSGIDSRLQNQENEIKRIIESLSDLRFFYDASDNIENSLNYLTGNLESFSESSRLDEDENIISNLLSTTNNLIRQSNDLEFSRSRKEEDYRYSFLNSINSLNVNPLSGEDITFEPDSVFNQNPTVNAIERSRLSIIKRLEWINTSLGGDVNINRRFNDVVRDINRENRGIRDNLGFISEKYESGGNGVQTISTGIDDPGGVSYGRYQLASNTGTMQNFLDSPEGLPFRQAFEGLKAGSEEFNEMYSRVVEQNAEAFDLAQRAYIRRTHYDPVLEYADQLGLDVDNVAIQEALFSQAVQHSFAGNKKILDRLIQTINDDSSNEEIINALYDIRGDYAIQFASASATTHRFDNERLDILELVDQRVSSFNDRTVNDRTANHVREVLDLFENGNFPVYNFSNIDRISVDEEGTLYEVNINTNRLIHETNTILLNMLGSVDQIRQTMNSHDDGGIIDHDEFHSILMSNIDNESSNVVDRDAMSAIFNQSVQEYERRMLEREEEQRQLSRNEENDSPYMPLQTNIPMDENDNRNETNTLLSQINSSNREILNALHSNNRTLQDYINRSI